MDLRGDSVHFVLAVSLGVQRAKEELPCQSVQQHFLLASQRVVQKVHAQKGTHFRGKTQQANQPVSSLFILINVKCPRKASQKAITQLLKSQICSGSNGARLQTKGESHLEND